MVGPLQGLFPGALTPSTSQEGLTETIVFQVQILAPDLERASSTPLMVSYLEGSQPPGPPESVVVYQFF